MDLLIELFSEEIPARMQARAREDLKSLVTNGLVEAGLTYASAGAFSTPRRLVLALEGLSPASKPQREERKGPATTAPQAAIEGFLRATGLRLDQLERRADKKGEAFFATFEKLGRPAAEIVAEVLEGTIRTFPWPKSMRWGAGSLRWVRPLHSIICLLTDETGAHVVPLTVEGITAGATTRGHRFMAPGAFTVTSFDDYAAKLRRAYVLLDVAEREAAIRQGAQNLAFAAGTDLVEDRALLSEVAGLVEWPVPLMGRISEDFLHLPPEVLQTSMREHQKFFSTRNPATGRIEGFVTVANVETADHGATILKGNQKVLTARLSDARFFWEKDLRVARAGMGEWIDGLNAVTFHAKLGSQGDRIRRIEALAREIAPLVGADPDDAALAARLAKADLRSAMVGEFPELQGVMGRYYALEAFKSNPPRPPSRGPEGDTTPVDGGPGSGPGRVNAIADAARDHYSPLGPTDDVPDGPVSVAVALADKIDTLTGFWAIDEKPTGSKDPFALRRAALGVIRLVLGNGVRIHMGAVSGSSFRGLFSQMLHSHRVFQLAPEEGEDVLELVDARTKPAWLAGAFFGPYFGDSRDVTFELDGDTFTQLLREGELIANLLAFFHDRLKVFLRDQGIRHDVIDACLAMPGNDDLTLLVRRAEALAEFLKTEDGENLLQGFRRANNILTQAEQKDGVEYSYGADPKFAETDQERALFAALDAAEAAIAPALRAEAFPVAMSALAALRAPIDAFFTAVQINTDNATVRRNRLNLLHRIRALCLGLADLTRIEG